MLFEFARLSLTWTSGGAEVCADTEVARSRDKPRRKDFIVIIAARDYSFAYEIDVILNLRRRIVSLFATSDQLA